VAAPQKKSIFRKSVEKTQDLLKFDKNKEQFFGRQIFFFDHISFSSS